VTLRARLTGAFLAVVLAPVLIGGIVVGATVSTVNHSRQLDLLESASVSLRAVVGATCSRLTATAEAAAAATAGGTKVDAADAFVTQGKASAIHIESASGIDLVTTADPPEPPWALCMPAPLGGVLSYPATDYTALASVVEMRSPTGTVLGYAYAAETLDTGFMRALAAGTGVDVTIVGNDRMSSIAPAVAKQTSEAAKKLAANRVGEFDGRYVRRVDPAVGEPLTFAVSVPKTNGRALFTVVAAVVLFAALAAISGAWALARTATRPLHELTEAASRVAHGQLDTRVPVRHDDEVGQVGAAFNRITREMQSYATALTASRDQLRGSLAVLGDTLASTHDLPRILQVILASARSAVGARTGVILLADPGDDQLRLECSTGFDPYAAALLEPLVVPFGAGLVGDVAKTARPRRGRVTGGDDGTTYAGDGGPAVVAGEPTCETFLAVPLCVPPTGADPSGIRGVLALYDRLGGGDFDDTDLNTVRTFGGHAAVAVDNVRLHDEAMRLSHTDPLTGLYNYRHLKELLRREVHRAARFGHSLAVVVMDLDRFKEVNDTYGHAAGDAVLVEFARRIGVEIRGVDLAFRYGGEEFVLLLPETDALGGITLAQRLGASVREVPMSVPCGHASGTSDVVSIPVTVSIGVAVYPEHGTSGGRVLETADDALYAAKAAGRDTFRLATPPASVDAVPTSPLPLVPAPLTAADVRAEVGVDVGAVLKPVDVSEARGTNSGRARAARRPRGGTSNGPQPPRQSRGR
jgi:diguanylate cyclase (GGDEF)-like protein